MLIQRADVLDWDFLAGVRTLGITAGASAPELLVRELVERLSERYAVTEREVETTRETIAFKLPRGLDAAA
jgi:4-hydroxy-3-methylbut-2-enyl diphosphate reductase